MEEDMRYGTAVRTPTKRKFLRTPTPIKSRKVVSPVWRELALVLWPRHH